MLDISGFLTSFEFLAQLAALVTALLTGIFGDFINSLLGVT